MRSIIAEESWGDAEAEAPRESEISTRIQRIQMLREVACDAHLMLRETADRLFGEDPSGESDVEANRPLGALAEMDACLDGLETAIRECLSQAKRLNKI